MTSVVTWSRPANVEEINDIHPRDLVSIALLSIVIQKVYLPTSLTNGVVLGNKPVGVSRYEVIGNMFCQVPEELDCQFRPIIQLMTCI